MHAISRSATGFLLDTTARRGGSGVAASRRDKAVTVLRSALLFALAAGSAAPALAFEGEVLPQDLEPERVYSPYAGRAYPDRVLFGDLHFHTNLSFDAGLLGTSLTASDGFRFARGEKVISNTGQPVQLVRPLDFLAVTDHAELMGLAPSIQTSDPLLLADPWGRHIYDLFNSGEEGRMAGLCRDHRPRHGAGDQPVQLPGADQVDLERRDRHRRRRTTSRASSPPSPASSGPSRRRATTCTGWWSSPTGRRRPSEVVPLLVLRRADARAALGLPRDVRGPDRRPGHRGAAQRQPVERADVLRPQFDGTPMTREYADAAHPLGADPRGEPDEGRRGDASAAVARRRVRRLRALGRRQHLGHRGRRRRTCCSTSTRARRSGSG